MTLPFQLSFRSLLFIVRISCGASLLLGSAKLEAGEITNLTWFSGVASVAGDIIMVPPAPNNDDMAGMSPNLVQVLQKNYVAIGPVDLVFDVVNTGGVTEYRINEGVSNSTPLDWSGYRLELGTGHGAGFMLSGSGDGLDFDALDYNSPVFFGGIFSTILVTEDVITASGGIVPAFSYAGNFVFHIDVPDDIMSFTIRQKPIGVPEPASWILVGVCTLAIAYFRRCGKR